MEDSTREVVGIHGKLFREVVGNPGRQLPDRL